MQIESERTDQEMRYALLKDDVKVLSSLNGETRIPDAIHNLPFRIIDESEKTYTVRFSDYSDVYEIRKEDVKSVIER